MIRGLWLVAALKSGRTSGRTSWLICGLAVALAAGLVAGCSSAPLVPPGVTDVTGTWEGIWNGGLIGGGRITLNLKQVGTRVTGDLAMSGVAAISATDGAVQGWIDGETFSFDQPSGAMEGRMAVNGEEMSGRSTGRLKTVLILRRLPPQ